MLGLTNEVVTSGMAGTVYSNIREDFGIGLKSGRARGTIRDGWGLEVGKERKHSGCIPHVSSTSTTQQYDRSQSEGTDLTTSLSESSPA